MIFKLLPFTGTLVGIAFLIYFAIRGLIERKFRKYLVLMLAASSTIILVQAFNQQQKIEWLAGGFTNQPIEQPSDGYVGSDKCAVCHNVNHASWDSSYHSTMTQQATPETVLGDFDQVKLSQNGEDYRLSRDGDRFYVSFTRPVEADVAGLEELRRQIVLITGSHHYQVYWYPAGRGRVLAQLPFVYLILEKTWVPRTAAFIQPPADSHSDEYGAWNTTCIRCHTTQGRPRPVNIGGEEWLDSKVAEFGISCEACHGPGREHIRLNANPLRRSYYHLSSSSDPSIVNPARLPAERSAQVCGQCHSVHWDKTREIELRWRSHGPEFRPGDDLNETRLIQTKAEVEQDARDGSILSAMYWPDGVIRIAGRQYNALLYSPCMVSEEFSCLNCHSLHQARTDKRSRESWADDQLKPEAFGNAPCLSCHNRFDNEQALTEHTHHEAQSPGSSCYNCHMPPTTYGLLGTMRSHQITSPDAGSSKLSGRPNACNLCHMDQTLAWTANSLNEWYDLSQPALSEEDTQVSAALLWLLKGDAAQRAVISASMKYDYVQQTSGLDWMPPFLVNSLADPYDANRMIALRSLRTIPGFENVPFQYHEEPVKIAAQQEEIMAIWRELYGGSRATRAQLLMINGQLDKSEVDRLMELQDQAEVFIAE